MTKQESIQGDLSSSRAIAGRLFATLHAARDMMKVEDVNGPQMKDALETLVKGVFAHPEFQEKTLLSADKLFQDGKHVNKEDGPDIVTLLELAKLAYKTETEEFETNLQKHGYQLYHRHSENRAGVVGYYTAVNHSKRELLIGVKGTSSIGDALTDCVAVTMPHLCAPSCPFEGIAKEREIKCHEGILQAAIKLAAAVEHILEELAIQNGYTVKIVGHSLGAGTAALLGVLLRTGDHDQLRDPKFLKVYAFAPPPIVDMPTAMNSKSFIFSVVNKADIVPRCSIANLEVVSKILSELAKELEVDDDKEFAAIRGKVARVKKESEAKKLAAKAALETAKAEGKGAFSAIKAAKTAGDSERVMHVSFETMIGIVKKVQSELEVDAPDKLYVPGEVLMFYDRMDAPTPAGEERIVKTGASIVDGTHPVSSLVMRLLYCRYTPVAFPISLLAHIFPLAYK
jgi:hypothetical protein